MRDGREKRDLSEAVLCDIGSRNSTIVEFLACQTGRLDASRRAALMRTSCDRVSREFLHASRSDSRSEDRRSRHARAR